MTKRRATSQACGVYTIHAQSKTLNPASTMSLSDDISAEEVRREAKFNVEQWRQFLVKLSFCLLALADV